MLRGPQGGRASSLSPSQLPAIRGLVAFADNKPWDKLRLERETQSKPENLPGLAKLLEPRLPVEPWSLRASHWALPGWGGHWGEGGWGVLLAVCQSIPTNLPELIWNFLPRRNDSFASRDRGGSLVAHLVKNLPGMQKTLVHPWIRKIP